MKLSSINVSNKTIAQVISYLVPELPCSANDMAIAASKSWSSLKSDALSGPNDMPPGSGREGTPLSADSTFVIDEEAAPALALSLDPPDSPSLINLGGTL